MPAIMAKKYPGNVADQYNIQGYDLGSEMIIPKGMQVDYVLGQMDRRGTPLVKLKIEKCVEVIESFITRALERTMNRGK